MCTVREASLRGLEKKRKKELNVSLFIYDFLSDIALGDAVKSGKRRRLQPLTSGVWALS